VPGDFLEIDGYVSDDGESVIATRLEREDPEDTTTIEGPVQQVVPNNRVRLLGIEVDLTGVPFDDGSFADIEEGTILEITWDKPNPDLSSDSPSEVEIEELDD
jgi:hypothetical protein